MLDTAEDPLGEQRLPATASLRGEAPGQVLEARLEQPEGIGPLVAHRDALVNAASRAPEVGNRHGEPRPLA